MGDYIIVAILIVILIFAARKTIQHFTGKGGGCCGSGGAPYEIKKKLNGPVVKTIELKIGKMKCDNCRIRVQNALNGYDGVKAKVNLKKGIAKIQCSKDVDPEALIRLVEQEGYIATL